MKSSGCPRGSTTFSPPSSDLRIRLPRKKGSTGCLSSSPSPSPSTPRSGRSTPQSTSRSSSNPRISSTTSSQSFPSPDHIHSHSASHGYHFRRRAPTCFGRVSPDTHAREKMTCDSGHTASLPTRTPLADHKGKPSRGGVRASKSANSIAPIVDFVEMDDVVSGFTVFELELANRTTLPVVARIYMPYSPELTARREIVSESGDLDMREIVLVPGLKHLLSFQASSILGIEIQQGWNRASLRVPFESPRIGAEVTVSIDDGAPEADPTSEAFSYSPYDALSLTIVDLDEADKRGYTSKCLCHEGKEGDMIPRARRILLPKSSF